MNGGRTLPGDAHLAAFFTASESEIGMEEYAQRMRNQRENQHEISTDAHSEREISVKSARDETEWA